MSRRIWPSALVWAFVAALLASRWLKADMLFVDEWWSIFKSGGDVYGPLSPVGIWDRIVNVDPGGMGAGYYLTLAGWETLVGSSPFAVRLFSLFAGILTVAMTFRVGTDWFSPRVGLAAAVLMASSAFFVNYMHEARAYTLVALLACCVVWTYGRVQTLQRPGWWYVALGAAFAGLAYSHYVALSLAAVVGIYHVAFARRDRRWLFATGVMIAAALLYVPWLPIIAEVARRGSVDINRQATSMTAAQAIGELGTAFSNGSPALLIVLVGAAALGVMWRLWPRSAFHVSHPFRPIAFLAVWLVAGASAALAVNAVTPFLVHLRYLIYLWPALALTAALGIEALRRRGVPAALSVGVWAAFGVAASLTPAFMHGQFGEIYRPPAAGLEQARYLLEEVAAAGDVVLYHIEQPGTEPFGLFIEDYLSRGLPAGVAHAQTEFMNNALGPRSDATYREDILAVLGSPQRVWIVDVLEIAETQRTQVLHQTLRESYADCGMVHDAEGTTVQMYAKRPDMPSFRQEPPYVYGDGTTGIARMAEVGGTSLGELTAVDSGSIALTLGWQASGPLRAGTHSVAVHLVDAAGTVVAQDDYPLPVDGFGCRASILPVDFAAGQYTVFVSVYDWQTLVPLPTAGHDDGRVPLGTLVVRTSGDVK